MALDFRILARAALAAFVLLVAGCASTGPTPSASDGTVPAAPSPMAPEAGTPGAPTKPAPTPGAPASPLVTEQRFFEDWFRGTPVVIASQGGSMLHVDVPLANSFDAGKADIKPALGAVLERVAESLRRQVGARITLSAPADPGGAPALSQARAQRVRDHLVARHIALPRISLAAGARAGAPLQMRLTIPPAAFPAVSRLRDATVVPSQGIKPVAATRADTRNANPKR